MNEGVPMNRRDLIKGGALIAVSPSLLTGCNPKPNQPPIVDQVIEDLKVADQTIQALVPILTPIGGNLPILMSRVDVDIQLVIKVYTEYDTAAGQTPTNADLIRSTAGTIQANLTAILDAVGVKNHELIVIVGIAVAVVNTALGVVLNHLPQPVTIQSAKVGGKLPTLDSASPADLKKAWNDAVKVKYPGSKI